MPETNLTINYSKLSQEAHEQDRFWTQDDLVSLFTLLGRRDAQEDRLAASTELTNFKSLSVYQKKSALLKTIAGMQQEHGQEKNIGTTLCGVIAWLEADQINITSFNVGDSSLYYIELDAAANLVQFRRLNALHLPNESINKAEYDRVDAYDELYEVDESKNLRLGGELMISRSLGDRKYEKHGLSHEPEICFFSNTLQPGHVAYMLVASDGLDKIQEIIGKIISNTYKKSMPANISDLLEAIMVQRCQIDKKKGGPGDNTSAALFKINSVVTSSIVLDGHAGEGWNGAFISDAIQKAFYPKLQRMIEFTLRNTPVEPPTLTELAKAGAENYLAFKRNRMSLPIDASTDEITRADNQIRWAYIQSQRGERALFTGIRHVDFPWHACVATQLLIDLSGETINPTLTMQVLKTLFLAPKTTFHRHSLTSFVLDQLIEQSDSLFSKKIKSNTENKYSKSVVSRVFASLSV